MPLKVRNTIDDINLKTAAIEKHANHDQMFCGLEEYAMIYPDGKEVNFIPGSSVKQNFTKKNWESPTHKISN